VAPATLSAMSQLRAKVLRNIGQTQYVAQVIVFLACDHSARPAKFNTKELKSSPHD
jgi:hypothetical protein